MRVGEVRKRVLALLELPESPTKKAAEIILTQIMSPKMVDVLTPGVAWECIWEEFEDSPQMEEDDLEDEVNPEIIENLIRRTRNFFSYIINQNPSARLTITEAKREQALILEALEAFKKELFP